MDAQWRGWRGAACAAPDELFAKRGGEDAAGDGSGLLPDAFVKGMMDKVSPEQMQQIHAKYGLEMLGPPLFPPTT